jgi:5S rRNA maturation endonuclease (ribonuclease M5)
MVCQMSEIQRFHHVSRWRERKLDELREIFRKLADKSMETVVLVEGKKDRSALRSLGILGKIVCMKHSGQILFDFLDQLPDREVVLLVDFDDYGASLARKVTQYLEEKRVKVNSVFWRRIRGLVRRDVKDIEGLPSYLEKLKKSPTVKINT